MPVAVLARVFGDSRGRLQEFVVADGRGIGYLRRRKAEAAVGWALAARRALRRHGGCGACGDGGNGLGQFVVHFVLIVGDVVHEELGQGRWGRGGLGQARSACCFGSPSCGAPRPPWSCCRMGVSSSSCTACSSSSSACRWACVGHHRACGLLGGLRRCADGRLEVHHRGRRGLLGGLRRAGGRVGVHLRA